MKKIDPKDYDFTIKIKEESDIILARQLVKNCCSNLGFTLADITKIVTAVSELARNIYRYAREGMILVKSKKDEPLIEIVAADKGPGIEDLEKALAGGHSAIQRSLGLGLRGVQRLMDSFEIESELGKGTIVKVKKGKRKF